ncbi:hypothetical protein V6N12_019654 [Hibiscus sabdariffa]|uniref:Uncharacterized protein n=1 Tax=Hibiscus sabdariffa TaxID=183260 RepID=A0ABR2B4X9_9ROSI
MAPLFVSFGFKSIEGYILVTLPSCVAEEKGCPLKIYLRVPLVILPLHHRSVTEVFVLGLTMKEEIRLAG